MKCVDNWTGAIVQEYLEGMSEIPEDETETWLEANVCVSLAIGHDARVDAACR